jgi:hypothetical protein
VLLCHYAATARSVDLCLAVAPCVWWCCGGSCLWRWSDFVLLALTGLWGAARDMIAGAVDGGFELLLAGSLVTPYLGDT